MRCSLLPDPIYQIFSVIRESEYIVEKACKKIPVLKVVRRHSALSAISC